MPRKKQYQWKSSDEAEGFDLPPSRSEKKRQSLALQNMGEELTRLGPQEVKNLDLPADLREALQLYARIGDHEGRRRQMQFIGRVMREIDPAPIRAMLDARREVSAAATAALHQAEQWRDRLLLEDSAQAEWIAHHPGTDIQQLRALIRQARKDAASAHEAAVAESQGLAPRKGRAYRELYALVRLQLKGGANDDTDDMPPEDEDNNDA